MLFRRRERRGLLSRLRDALWPRRGWQRAARYVGFRLSRLKGSPHALACGFAWGAAASFTPLMGLHIAVAAGGSLLTRGSVVAAAIGTVVGNPWTFPFIWLWAYAFGSWLLGMDGTATSPVESVSLLAGHVMADVGYLFGIAPEPTEMLPKAQLRRLFHDVFVPMMAGGVPTGALAWAAFYFPLRRLIARHHLARQKRRLLKLTGQAGGRAGAGGTVVSEHGPGSASADGKEPADGS